MAKDSMQKTEKRPERQSATSSGTRANDSGTTGERTGSRTGANGDSERGIATSRDGGVRSPSSSTGLSRQGRGSMGLGDPMMLMQRMSQDMDRLFEQFGLGRGMSGFGLSPLLADYAGGDGESGRSPMLGTDRTLWAPQVEVRQRGDRMVVCADLPGVSRDDLTVEVRDGALVLSGERREEREEDGEGFYRSERSYGRFYRTIPLPDGVNAEQAQATFRDGVLEVALPLPKEEKQSAKRIAIR